MNESIIGWLALSHINGIGFNTWQKYFNSTSPETIFALSCGEINDLPIPVTLKEQLQSPPWRQAEEDLRLALQTGSDIITIEDSRYPSLLKEIASPPIILYALGAAKLLSTPQLAIVGSRHASVMGLESARSFGYGLAESGVTVTSGLALGIDAAAHEGALNANGNTIAVLGTGLQHIYPKRNRRLADKIIEDNLIISEFTYNTPPLAQHFPRRNRIISGLSLGTLVVEASLHSGSLITARYALEQNREVFAVPGSIHQSTTKGCHALLREGAKLVENLQDILDEIPILIQGIKQSETSRAMLQDEQTLDKDSINMLQYVGFEVTPIDVIIRNSEYSLPRAATLLTYLELNHWVRAVSGGYIRVLRETR